MSDESIPPPPVVAIKRPFETRYWPNASSKAFPTRGYPKAEMGSISGAAKAVALGDAFKVECVDRYSGEVLWTVRRGLKVPGVHVWPVYVFKGRIEGKGS